MKNTKNYEARLMIDMNYYAEQDNIDASFEIDGNLLLLTEMVTALLKSRDDLRKILEGAIEDLNNKQND